MNFLYCYVLSIVSPYKPKHIINKNKYWNIFLIWVDISIILLYIFSWALFLYTHYIRSFSVIHQLYANGLSTGKYKCTMKTYKLLSNRLCSGLLVDKISTDSMKTMLYLSGFLAMSLTSPPTCCLDLVGFKSSPVSWSTSYDSLVEISTYWYKSWKSLKGVNVYSQVQLAKHWFW